ncbi:hypothetical protein BDE27_2777 [Xenorhabdus ehlersii]|uniref:Uncharacterized protein n=1 Tax=Xenorhabdus ehlersii TaxID=290111 RepID=A0A2D0IPY6_9GAMM|nr:hypothetical protein Xehl_02556 [Xenorhabdus ehlersii]RKE89166.1 hypothetical protein BDE27_2777 [Xenorhabdus ehlersii]
MLVSIGFPSSRVMAEGETPNFLTNSDLDKPAFARIWYSNSIIPGFRLDRYMSG